LLCTDGTEFKLVTSEGEGRSPVTIGEITVDGRKSVDLDIDLGTAELNGLEMGLRESLDGTRFFNGVKNLGEMSAKEDGNDAGRSFVSAKTMIIRSTSDTCAKESTMLMHGVEDGDKEEEKTEIGFGFKAGIKKIITVIGRHGPIAMFSASVHTFERFLVEKDL